MSHITKEEYLSAYLDGESGSFEQQRLSDQLADDDLMQEKLSNYALLGESMRHQSQPLVAGSSFLAGIQDAIADEEQPSVTTDAPVVEAPTKIETKGKQPRQFVGYAVAASVAAIAAVSMQSYFTPAPEAPMMAAVAPAPVIQSVAAPVSQPQLMKAEFKPAVETTNYTVPDAEMRRLMNQYVAYHFQHASSNTLMPRVRAVSYSTDF
ncbi:hypothetical protein EOL70_13880 [Leucothrix sargassi]|nr:hypothetical protein EOL70_13880 [Leucothrix sargassi]